MNPSRVGKDALTFRDDWGGEAEFEVRRLRIARASFSGFEVRRLRLARGYLFICEII
jgi:hypothetical protein